MHGISKTLKEYKLIIKCITICRTDPDSKYSYQKSSSLQSDLKIGLAPNQMFLRNNWPIKARIGIQPSFKKNFSVQSFIFALCIFSETISRRSILQSRVIQIGTNDKLILRNYAQKYWSQHQSRWMNCVYFLGFAHSLCWEKKKSYNEYQITVEFMVAKYLPRQVGPVSSRP